MFVTHLSADHRRNGELVRHYDLGSGLITVTCVNTLVSDAVTGSSVVPTLARLVVGLCNLRPERNRW